MPFHRSIAIASRWVHNAGTMSKFSLEQPPYFLLNFHDVSTSCARLGTTTDHVRLNLHNAELLLCIMLFINVGRHTGNHKGTFECFACRRNREGGGQGEGPFPPQYLANQMSLKITTYKSVHI